MMSSSISPGNFTTKEVEVTSSPTIHEKAAKGFQIAGDAYERGRPEYPVEALSYLIESLNITEDSLLVDIGAGTGKFTKLLRNSNAKIIAVEPVDGMRKKFKELLPSLEIVSGTAESMPFENFSVDCAIAAQAFHWFDSQKALVEINRILKSRGRLGLIWNARDESIDWVSKLTSIIDPYEGGAPRYKNLKLQEIFAQTKLFTPLQYRAFQYVQSGDVEMVVDRVASISFISALNQEKRSIVLNEVRRLINNHPQTRLQTKIDIPYRTDVFWCEKICP